MIRFRRHFIATLAAAALPVIFLAGFQVYQTVNTQRERLERDTIARARDLALVLDGAVKSDLKLASALMSAPAVREGDIPAAYRRAAELSQLSGTWRTVVLSDLASGTELFDLRRPLSSPRKAMSQSAALIAAQEPTKLVMEGISPDPSGGYWIPLYLPVWKDGRLRYLVTVAMEPQAVQRLAAPYFSKDVVGAVVDRDGRFIARNVNYQSRLGHPATQYVRSAIKRPGSGLYRGVTYEGLSNYTAYATAPTSGWSAHLAVDSGLIDKPRRWAFITWTIVGIAGLGISGFFIWLAFRDLASKRQDEERLRQSQKLEAVGQLTGGIAHDFNNLLTAIIGGLELVLKRSAPDDKNIRYIEGALEAATRGAKLTARLLAFSRTQRMENVQVDVGVVLKGMTELLDQSLGPRIHVAVNVPDAVWVTTDPNQLELALLNLAVNARDAMPDGGRLEFSTRRVRRQLHRNMTNCVEIAVSDTGCGMSREVISRAFEPFFTTKDASKGTGLGLAQVFALARQSSGEVDIESQLGEGTTVRLLLPAALSDGNATSANASIDRSPEIVSGSGQRILVLDDDDAVRAILVENLRARGYVVFQASNGDDALEAMSDIDPDLFILDFLMPGINGAEVAEMVRQVRPAQKMLIVSGHLDHAVLAQVLVEIPILRKPFDGDQLAAKVTEILAADAVIQGSKQSATKGQA